MEKAIKDSFDAYDEASKLLFQARAMAFALVGEGRPVFDSWNEEMRDGYTWALFEKVKDAERALKQVTPQQHHAG